MPSRRFAYMWLRLHKCAKPSLLLSVLVCSVCMKILALAPLPHLVRPCLHPLLLLPAPHLVLLLAPHLAPPML
ncbi:hypothetical protein B0T25DRAFT_530882 [Lasiosphaeria hispida]|uniref:Uncharacterized protein n=1 Tax=Lasiosphaeria hispida TaxID=260671 RepID=A0AAJ0HNR9_9PEZI|nr:hypothetical protein B0T25DRAFT_530882 [Lasiosphaeria hispida]